MRLRVSIIAPLRLLALNRKASPSLSKCPELWAPKELGSAERARVGCANKINVTSPTGIRAIRRLGGPALAAALRDAIGAKRTGL